MNQDSEKISDRLKHLQENEKAAKKTQNELPELHAMPQGDPAGPLIMTLWIISGRQFVQSQVGPLLGSVFTRVYVDDRTLVSSSAEALADHFHKWTAWSAQVGLVENSNKACVVGRGKHMVSRLKGVFPDVVADSADILGVSWRAGPRGNSKKETDIGLIGV